MPEVSLPTQQFVDIKEVRNGVVYLKQGGMRKILIVSGVNFDLKSEAEQTAILSMFQNFINTIDFPVQFFIHSRKVNIETYLERMRERLEKEENELLKIQIAEYIEFIRSFVEQNAIINKTFFAIVPYDGATTTAAGGMDNILSMFNKPQSADVQKQQSEHAAIEQLDLRVTEISNGIEQIGLRVTPLSDEEIIELFYNLYNPQLQEKKGLEITKKQ